MTLVGFVTRIEQQNQGDSLRSLRMFKNLTFSIIIFIIVARLAGIANNAYPHGGKLAADGCHNDNVRGERHCHNAKQPAEIQTKNTVIYPKLNLGSYLCHKVEIVSIHDGDTVTILINKRKVNVRLAGIDAPELSKQEERDSAETSKLFLSHLIIEHLQVGGEIIVLFEASDSTLDGIKRGAFGRPLAYLFLIRHGTVEKFVNFEMIHSGNAKKSEYPSPYNTILSFSKDRFDITNIDLNLEINNQQKASIAPQFKITTTWAKFKKQ